MSVRPGEGPEPLANGAMLRKALAWLSADIIFRDLPLHGNTKWAPVALVTLTIFWVWSNATTLTGAFRQAACCTLELLGLLPVHSYHGLTGALVTGTGQRLLLLRQRLQQCMAECGHDHWRLGGWLPLAVDGTRVSTPRTVRNEKAFGAPNYGQNKTATALGQRVAIPHIAADVWPSQAAEQDAGARVGGVGLVAAGFVDDPPVCRQRTDSVE